MIFMDWPEQQKVIMMLRLAGEGGSKLGWSGSHAALASIISCTTKKDCSTGISGALTVCDDRCRDVGRLVAGPKEQRCQRVNHAVAEFVAEFEPAQQLVDGNEDEDRLEAHDPAQHLAKALDFGLQAGGQLGGPAGSNGAGFVVKLILA